MQIILLFACLLFLPLMAAAQETPKTEVFGGYSYLRTEGGGNLHGWKASVAANVNEFLGLGAEFAGNYGSDSVRVTGPGGLFLFADADSNLHTFLFGPRFSLRTRRATPFAHALFGAARAHTEGRVDVPGFSFSTEFSDTDTAFAMELGGGLDVRLNQSVALRLIQVDYLRTRFNDDTQHHARISVGLVFRFGER
ncbi:MAG TPA: outer membrane beta-barrel protein [Blastocatellia bacterium]|nr:outer membrane beta-barrel protein [Blastocatellia bacterium]